MSTLTTVSRAVAIAVRVSCDLTQNVSDEVGFAHSVGKRIQGTYGAELRRVADQDPAASAQDLYEAVIAPVEFPWMAVENPHAPALLAAGDRDRARHAKADWQKPHSAADIPLDPDWRERLAEVRACVAEPVIRGPKPIVADPEFMSHIDELRACVEAGRAQFQAERRARLDGAK